MSNNKRPLCLYHASCMDGLGAAAIVYSHFLSEVDCKAIRYGDAVPIEEMIDRDVYLVDFTFTPEELLPYLDVLPGTPKPRSITIIDHHHDAMVPWLQYAMPPKYDNLHVYYDSTRSGASLVWWFFHGDKPMPLAVQYLQEYDLWTKQLPYTDEVQAALRQLYPPKDEPLAELANFIETADEIEISRLAEVGAVLLGPERTISSAMIKRGLFFVDFAGYQNVACCPCPPELVNMVGEMIYTQYPEVPFVIMFEDNYRTGERKYSFRSPRGTGVDVSRVAQLFGGKGHENASGARVKMDLDPMIKAGVDVASPVRANILPDGEE